MFFPLPPLCGFPLPIPFAAGGGGGAAVAAAGGGVGELVLEIRSP